MRQKLREFAAAALGIGGCTCCCSGQDTSSITSGSTGCTAKKDWRYNDGSTNGGAVGPRERAAVALAPNQCWSLDFVSDTLASGRRIRLLTVEDTCTREALTIAVDTSLPAARVVRTLDEVLLTRGTPRQITLDNGPELTSRRLGQWAYEHGVQLCFIDPGKPIQNAYCESFNGRLRDECLNEHRFLTMHDAQRIVEDWRQDYNRERPHSSLGYRTPEEVRATLTGTSTLAGRP